MSAPGNSKEAVEAGSKALKPMHGYPWYDPSADGLRRIELSVKTESRSEPITVPASTGFGQVVFFVVWTALAIVLAGIIYLILKAWSQRDKQAKKTPQEKITSDDRVRIEALPFPVAAEKNDLLEEARRHYEQGNYGKAILYLFSYQLVQLDKHHVIRLAKGKTNRQYLREVGSRDGMRQLLSESLIRFEDVFFGHHPLDRSSFEACWSRLSEFQSLLLRKP